MSFLGGLLRTVAPLALTALTGGAAAPLMAMAMKGIAAELGKMVIDYVGQQLGAAFSDISRAQSSIDDNFGTRGQSANRAIQEYGEAVGASPSEIGRMQNQFDVVKQNMKDQLKQHFDDMRPDSKEKIKGKKSWLQVLADGMTKILDASLAKVSQKTTALTELQRKGGDLKGKEASNNTAETTAAQQEFAVANQEFNILMNSVNTAIKTIGEGLASMARKQ
jgi:hypothetical protein